MTQALDQSILELLRASRDDEETIYLPVNDRTFGFHAQQAVEKLLKALIGGHVQRYEFTHDLGVLIRHLHALGERLPAAASALEALTGYAGAWRYQEPVALSIEQRTQTQTNIVELRKFVFARLAVLRPAHPWNESLR